MGLMEIICTIGLETQHSASSGLNLKTRHNIEAACDVGFWVSSSIVLIFQSVLTWLKYAGSMLANLLKTARIGFQNRRYNFAGLFLQHADNNCPITKF